LRLLFFFTINLFIKSKKILLKLETSDWRLAANGLALGEEADFEALNFLPALKPLFCQTTVMCSCFY